LKKKIEKAEKEFRMKTEERKRKLRKQKKNLE